MNRTRPGARRLADRRGLAGLEFALMAPVLVVLLLGTADLMIWMRTWLRLEQSTSELGELVTQYKTLYTSDFTGVFYPIAMTGVGGASLACTAGGMVVTGISNTSGTTKVIWQWTSGTCAVSAYSSGTTSNLPGGYVPPAGVGVIVIELFTTQNAWVFSAGLMKSTGLSSVKSYSVLMPRTGTLPTYTSGTRPMS
jgi:Flp pilus assembly protein TadG